MHYSFRSLHNVPLAVQVLATKDAALFRQLVKFYETKQYKKGIKNADQVQNPL